MLGKSNGYWMQRERATVSVALSLSGITSSPIWEGVTVRDSKKKELSELLWVVLATTSTNIESIADTSF